MEDVVDAKGQGGGDQADARGEQSSSYHRFRKSAPSMKDSDFVKDYYNMEHKERGIAVIINNKNFMPKTRMGLRNGTDVDCNNMFNLLTDIGFQDIRIVTDGTTMQMQDALLEVSKENHENHDCFVCVILTHGDEGFVYGIDDRIELQELVKPFKGNACPSLAGKPKLFFIQACRGTELDPGVEVADAIGEGEEAMDEDVAVRRIPTEADFLMSYSVVPGYYSWRNSTNGSWFIQAVFRVFSENWRKMDVLRMMTRVSKQVAYDFESNASRQEMTNKKQIPCITSMLTKDLFFGEINY